MTTTAVNLFVRLWDSPTAKLTPTLARHILRLGFSDEDNARMRELLRRNSAGTITAEERVELDDFSKVGDLLGIIQSKARKVLKAKTSLRKTPA